MRDLLTVDAGNSTLDLMLHAVGQRRRFAIDDRGPDLRAFLGQEASAECVLLSVRAGVLDELLPLLRAGGRRCRVVGVDLLCPLHLDYATPQTLGADRWIGALAAHRQFGRAVVIDCGSATTVNLVEADGVFRGGPIAPGLGAFLAGMSAATPALPVARLDAEVSAPPRSSQQAVDTGVLAGYCGMVERLVADLLRVARGPTQVVVTGGRGELLLRHSRLRARLEPDLVHAGLRILAEETPCSS